MSAAHLIIVDDDVNLLEALSEAIRLRMKDVVVDISDSAESALAMISQTDYEAIVSDIKMPGMDGLALLREIRVLRPETPTLLITGHGERELAVQALRGGAYDFIQKPIDRYYFVASLERAIQIRRLRRRVEEQNVALSRHAVELERLVQERTRELREANQAKDIFLATLSHELRSPLNAILGWAKLLRSGKLDKETEGRALEAIERNAQTQAELIGDLMDVSRIVTGKLRLDARPIDLAPVIEGAVDAVRPSGDAKSLGLDVQMEAEGDLVRGDRSRLSQVISNLLSNAVKFTPPGGKINVSLRRIGSYVSLTVTDTGIGISPEFLPHVFDRFRQADGTTIRTHRGLGLGLAIVRHLVELHGGTVGVESKGIGKGAAFIVNLPLVTMNAAEQIESRLQTYSRISETGAATEELILGGCRVLVIDDELDAREMLQVMLAQQGANVTTASSVAEALDAFDEVDPDVIVSDIALPGEDGYSMIRKIRSRLPEQGGLTPAVAISAFARGEDRAQALAAGFQAHIAKPVESDWLIAVVSNLIAGNRPAGLGSRRQPRSLSCLGSGL